MTTILVWVLVVSKQFDNATWHWSPGFPLIAFATEEQCQKALQDYEHGACWSLQVTVGENSVKDAK
jgi:hypothetical protein